MPVETMSTSQIYNENYCMVRSRFLAQFGDAAEADACLKELKHQFSNHIENYCQESNVKLRKVFMIMVGKVTTEKLAEKRRRRENTLLNRIRNQAAQTLKEGVDFGQFALQLVGSIRELRLRQLPAALR